MTLPALWSRKQSPAPLVQIRRGYEVSCHDLRMTIEGVGDDWLLTVRDRDAGRTVHSARRCNLAAAKLAAAEFAVFRMTGAVVAETVQVVESHLPWTEYW